MDRKDTGLHGDIRHLSEMRKVKGRYMPPIKKKVKKAKTADTVIRVKDDTRKKCHHCGDKIGYHFECGQRVCGSCGVPPRVKCANCGKRWGTVTWTGDAASILAFTHGMWAQWCEICALEAQLEHAKERAAKIPEIEKRLAELKEK